jgi:WD40 repeat protein/DNA-binding SARP family transcriptional activator
VPSAGIAAAPQRYQPGIGGVDARRRRVDSRGVGIGVLGPVTVDGAAAGLGRRDRVVLAVLAVRPGEVVGAERLADALWGETLPASWPKVVQGCIVRLRKGLGPAMIETVPHGYRLALPGEEVDATRFERLLARGRELLSVGESDRAAYVLGEALALWRGPALVELEDWDPGRVEARRLDELRVDAEELHLEAALRAGRHRDVLGAARGMVEQAPLRERRWALLALAQYQSGQQGEALRSLGEARRVLARELGLDPGPDLVALEEAVLRQDPALVAEAALPPARPTCPYRGLVPYDVGDADDFYGRDDDVTAGLRKLSVVGALVVTGPSGSGKSSLVRAGLAAALERDGHRVVIITPGAHPLDALTVLPRAGPAPVLVVDQCEEAVWLCTDPAERAGFFAALTAYAERARLIVAVRADRLGDLSAYPGFARLVERGLYLLNPLTADELRAAIEGPARGAGLRLEPGLTDLLVLEVEGEPGALPLLSHALRATWERREANTLTVAGYQDTGGIRGAVAQSAEAVYQQVPAQQRPALRDLLLRLVAPNPEGDPMRSRVPRRLVAGNPEHEQLVETLVRARLVTSDDGVVELAHEALARAWPRLQDWLEEDVEGQRILRHLSIAADSWDSMGRPDSEVYRGTRLASALEWRAQASPDLTDTEQEFLDAGRRLADAEEYTATVHARRLRGLLTGVALLSVAALIAAGIAVNQRYDAVRQRNEAVTLALAAASRGVAASNGGLALALAAESSAATPAGQLQATAALIEARRVFDQNPAQPVREPLTGHTGAVVALAFSPDGDQLASAGNDQAGAHGTVQMWDPATGDRLAGPLRHRGRVTSVAFRPDGDLLAAGTDDPTGGGVVELWDPDTGRQVRRLPPGDAITAVAFSPDGDLLATADEGGAVRLWDPDTGRQMRRLRHGDAVSSVAFSPDGKMLATGSAGRSGGGALRLWHPATGRPLPSPPLGSGVEAVAFSPGGRLLATAHLEEVRLWDPNTGHRVGEPLSHDAPVRSVAFSPGGDLLATGSGRRSGGTVRLWDPARGRPAGRPFGSHPGVVTAIAFSPDRDLLASGGSEGVVRLWDPAPDDPSSYVLHQGTGASVAFSPDGELLAIPGRRTGAGLVEPTTGTRVRGLQWAAPTALPTFVPVGQSLAFSPTGDLLAAAGGDTVRVWDPATGDLLRSFDGRSDIGAVAFSPDGELLAVGYTDARGRGGGTRLLDAKGDPVGEPLRYRGRVSGVAFSPTGSVLATAGSDGVQLSDPATGDLVGEPLRQGGFVTSVAFSPDGRILATGGADGAVRQWDPSAGDAFNTQPLRTMTGHTGGVSTVSFSPDGRMLASGGTDGAVWLWDPAIRNPVGGILVGRTGALASVAFSPKGGLMAVAGEDGSVRLWPWDAEQACELAGPYVTTAQVEAYLPSGWDPACRYAD